MLTLYTTALSANGRKVLAVSHHLGLQPRIEPVDVYRGEGRTPEYLAINPLGKIPTLVEGDLVLSESNAILLYLAEAHGDCRLWAREPRSRAEIARWLFWEASQWQPALTEVLRPFVGHALLPDLVPAPAGVNWGDEGFRVQARLLESQLTGRDFVAGDELTLADFSVAAMLMYVRNAHFPATEFPRIAAWYAGIDALPAWRATAVAPWA